MPHPFVQLITSNDPSVRNQSLDSLAHGLSLNQLLEGCRALDEFRRKNKNLYERVRALFFLYSIHRFYLPQCRDIAPLGSIPYTGYTHWLNRRFEESIDSFQEEKKVKGPSQAISSALAASYHALGFQTLANQVRRSVRSIRGNQWMFRMGHPADHPLRIRPELLHRPSPNAPFPILKECTPVRMDLTHSGWSDIFFLGMDFPEGARVINTSIDLGVWGRDAETHPPVEAYLRVLDEPVLRLSSVDLESTVTIRELWEVFDFARDYLGLLKAAIIAAGIVPPGIEGSEESLQELLSTLLGPNRGLEIVSNVNHIPKGSRLAVSTNLLSALIAVCMRATGQIKSLSGSLQEEERRLVAGRAIFGEWLGGSGGGWQDSGGVWPGMKLIQGVLASSSDPEYGISRGRLLPQHQIFTDQEISPQTRDALQSSLVLVHGGMAQNVGPILEMVTEKYLLRSEKEWKARLDAGKLLDEITQALKTGNIPAIGHATEKNFFGPIQTIIPWASNAYTEHLIQAVRSHFGKDFHGFWMLGGMSGGGMGFIFAPSRKSEAQAFLLQTMRETKKRMEHSLPFAMEPVVYDFKINPFGTSCQVLKGIEALMPVGYYAKVVPDWLRTDPKTLAHSHRNELDLITRASRERTEFNGLIQKVVDSLLPQSSEPSEEGPSLRRLLEDNGFDPIQHEQVRDDLISGRIGLAQNRLPAESLVEDILPGDVDQISSPVIESEWKEIGIKAIQSGQIATMTLAAGVGSRWTQGAGVVKAINPFCKFGSRHRSFLELHLAKNRLTSHLHHTPIPHIIATSYLTHHPIQTYLQQAKNHGYPGPLFLSEGRAIGLRLVPMVRDLRFAWEEMPQQRLDEQKQKVRDSIHAALMGWAKTQGEGKDYTQNLPHQCLHPVGHWYEFPNLLLNGTLKHLLEQCPNVQYLMLHNIDTLGANIDPVCLGSHIARQATLTFEVIARQVDDRGGGLARVNGKLRLVEGLAMPREEDEFKLSYYNSNTTWIHIDRMLNAFELTRQDLSAPNKITQGLRKLASRMPTYITLKEVKKRWGNGQEDIYPVAQFEKLWGDLSTLSELNCHFLEVPRLRGQQLKDPAQLDGWYRDGSARYVDSLCRWEEI